MVKKTDIIKAEKLYIEHMALCDKLTGEISTLLRQSAIADMINGPVSVEYDIGRGLVVVLELDDGEAPHAVDIFYMLSLIKKGVDKITYSDIISGSI